MAPVLAGAVPGWWLFGWRGTLLFSGLALAAMLVYRSIARRRPGLGSGLALLGVAVLFQASSTLTWGGADVPDGTRYKASPVGLSLVLTPNRTVSETVDCGWHAVSGYATPCEVASAPAFLRLRLVYPLVVLAALACGAGAGMSLQPRWCLHPVQRGVATGAALAALGAVPLFLESMGTALAPLQGLAVGVGGTLGMMQLVAGVVLGAVVATGTVDGKQ
ncbi:MAG: hypothetical protein ACREMH_11385 [Gemmatimonadales bacterium]